MNATTIVTDTGFAADDWTGGFTPLAEAPANDVRSLDLPSDADVDRLLLRLEGIEMIRVDFPNFADGRGFTIARRLRDMGYGGRLRARGHVLADQYAMARRSGFDEVEIDAALAARQPEDQWLARANWRDHDYRAALRA
ncbi:conserved hypothetical protein [Dinoroseobacter shibae DFL 12 = DSM 16493]|jgi:uncharacterized protein (DUF934 family)|uniref:Oxidoreductase n=1 Tax=Dinoroseobacter shibae (strain DSM 16493 / NCIMB 14021 / DFL 12) TaxID=398580 RepID=A8LHU6_DINSH|nr:DUF934 domain-containing protein [Dinoroseobacter shibae]ABV92893.1 conserved hypothetical protein [Dinoroseobacter shibae DFL 12 = DSM 16493]URF47829.1 DUF934 domain-containing protein [Dinoroseobacter shibae]URF52138.1 DUF934 domain-containing protein [Dinoroseobacter shibae]